jgi:hypothetical protein
MREPIDFFFVKSSEKLIFHETADKPYAIISGVLMELDKPSTTHRLYQFDESESIADSMMGKPIFYGTDWKGKHDTTKPPVGSVLTARVNRLARNIFAYLKIYSKELVNRLKRGEKFLFSIQGTADKAVQKSNVRHMLGAVVNSLQMVPFGTNVGFPNAQMEKLVSLQETVLFTETRDFRSSIEEFMKSPAFNKALMDAMIEE